MTADKTTLNDLAIFAHEEEQSVFHHLDFTRTLGGRDWLRYYLAPPLTTLKEIEERQQLLKCILNVVDKWPQNITNGTVMVLQKFYETAIQSIPHRPGIFGALSYKFINGADYSLIKYSVGHFAEFIKGLNKILELLSQHTCPAPLQTMLERIQRLLSREEIQRLLRKDPAKELSVTTVLVEGFFLRENFKSGCNELIEIYSQLDAFYSMVIAGINYRFNFPRLI